VTPNRRLPARTDWPRLLDPVRSIKAKLGLLVVASVIVTAMLTWYGIAILGWWPRYTLPVAVLVALVITQVLAHGMTAPLRQMIAAAREMAAGRKFTGVQTTSQDEVGELARAFTAMARDIETAHEQRRELLANVGHELRTPVAALRAQLENLVDGIRPADAEALGEVLDQVQRMGVLVDDLLDLARVEAGAALLDRYEVPLRPLVEDVVAQVDKVRTGRILAVDVPSGLTADIDPARLRQVLVNLVDNAARHTPAGGRVDVTGVRTGDLLVLEVTDDGPGIPPAERDTVFERFQRGGGPVGTPPNGLRADGGTGLGLAIARWAVSLHGGTIAVVPSPGRGARIRVEIPSSTDPNSELNSNPSDSSSNGTRGN
jgi:signal transduction histidine kinase